MTFETTSKGKPMVRDSNNYTYVANTSSTEVKYWKYSVKMHAQLEFEPEFLPQTRYANIIIEKVLWQMKLSLLILVMAIVIMASVTLWQMY